MLERGLYVTESVSLCQNGSGSAWMCAQVRKGGCMLLRICACSCACECVWVWLCILLPNKGSEQLELEGWSGKKYVTEDKERKSRSENVFDISVICLFCFSVSSQLLVWGVRLEIMIRTLITIIISLCLLSQRIPSSSFFFLPEFELELEIEIEFVPIAKQDSIRRKWP